MNHDRSQSSVAKLNVVGLVLAAAGMGLERVSGSTLYPTLAGPLVLVVVAAVVALRPGRWTGYLGLVVPLVLAVGLVVSAVVAPTFVDQLTDVANAGTFIGSVAHVVGLVAALAGGIGMVLRPRANPTAEPIP
jgi:hypothetical protein